MTSQHYLLIDSSDNAIGQSFSLQPLTHCPEGLWNGLGCFTSFLYRKQDRDFGLCYHQHRLNQACESLGWESPPNLECVLDYVDQWHQAPFTQNNQISSSLRITVTPEYASFLPVSGPRHTQVLLSIRPCLPTPTESIAATVMTYDRQLPHLKLTQYAVEQQLLQQAAKAGFNELIRVTQSGLISEASAANLFIVQSPTLWLTPSVTTANCLPGVTRQRILDAANTLGITIHETDLQPEIFTQAQGVLLTNALKGVRLVSQIDQTHYSSTSTNTCVKQVNSYLRFHDMHEPSTL